MKVHHLTLPLTEQDARSLKAGDLVLLNGDIVITAGLPTHQRIKDCLDANQPLPMDLAGAAVFHLGSYSRDANGKLEVLYMNPTTSTRFNPFMPEFIRKLGLRAVGGKGGLDRACADAMKEVGCVYLSFLGGGAPLLSAAIQEVVDVQWKDLIAHYRLVKLRVKDLGPLTVGIDAHGNNVYEDLKQSATEQLNEILADLERARGATKAR